ncbi:MAG: Nitroreductase [Parcubacteria group bacterium GW2011_GWA2_44_12]|nr:MAG: Nitroreductase [Parcubacteria group bacterium GW2011_GWA2_44_12]
MTQNVYPHKPIITDHEIAEFLKKRWSPLAFSDQPIAQETLNSLFEAIRWAPSSYNEQPWRVIYATQENPEEFTKLASLLAEGNVWAKNAYVLMLICAYTLFSQNGKENYHAVYDAGGAAENLFLQAASMDLIAHQMAGFDREKAYTLLRLPQNVKPLAMIAVGYPSDAENLSSDLQERHNAPRVRKSIAEFVYKGVWKS